MHAFRFHDPLSSSASISGFVIEIPAGLSSKNVLLDALANAAEFPSYFGKNWDALSDCLRDFEWVAEKQIRIVHHDLPLNDTATDRSIYLGILNEAVASWADEASRTGFAAHELTVYFPKATEREIAVLLRD